MNIVSGLGAIFEAENVRERLEEGRRDRVDVVKPGWAAG